MYSARKLIMIITFKIDETQIEQIQSSRPKYKKCFIQNTGLKRENKTYGSTKNYHTQREFS